MGVFVFLPGGGHRAVAGQSAAGRWSEAANSAVTMFFILYAATPL